MPRKPSKQAHTWHDSRKFPPPAGAIIWGYCVMYGEIHLASWDGRNKCDNDYIFIDSLENQGDDYYLRLWTECDVPEGPAQDLIDKLREEDE